MKLDRVDQLSTGALDHHLIAAEIRSREQLETFRNAIELQPVVLPYVQDVRATRIVRCLANRDVGKDGIVEFLDANVALLVLERASGSLLVLLEFVERHDSGAEAQADELMAAANREDRNFCFANEVSKIVENRIRVVIEIA